MAEDFWSAERYARDARFVSDLGAPVVTLLRPRPGERILDLGCGDGRLGQELAAVGADVVGIDSSSDMVRAARARGLDARVMAAEALDFAEEFDAVFSNAALHWMTRPDAVIRGVSRALRPGGRFVGEFGGHGNVAAIHTAIVAVLSRDYGRETALEDVWYFPTADAYGAKLEAGGFEVQEIELIPRPTLVEAGIEAWLRTLAAPALGALGPAERERAIVDIARLVRPALRDEGGQWWADYVRLRFRARAI